MLITSSGLDDIIKTNSIESEFEETKVYIKSVYIKYANANLNKFNESFTLKYIDAINDYKFDKYQNIGDELLFINTFFPKALNGASIDYYHSLASSCYYKCHVILKGQWPLFQELSGKFSYFVGNISEENKDLNLK